jgi:hypothetical protein
MDYTWPQVKAGSKQLKHGGHFPSVAERMSTDNIGVPMDF